MGQPRNQKRNQKIPWYKWKCKCSRLVYCHHNCCLMQIQRCARQHRTLLLLLPPFACCLNSATVGDSILDTKNTCQCHQNTSPHCPSSGLSHARPVPFWLVCHHCHCLYIGSTHQCLSQSHTELAYGFELADCYFKYYLREYFERYRSCATGYRWPTDQWHWGNFVSIGEVSLTH